MAIYLDFISLLMMSLALYLPYDWSPVLSMVVLLKLYDIFRFDNLFFRALHTYKTFNQIYILFKIILAMLYINHLLGCMLYYFDKTLIDTQHYGNVNFNPQCNTLS